MPARRVNIDPSIQNCAASLMVEAMKVIEADCVAGVEFYRVRAIETRAAVWVRLYRKDAADIPDVDG